MQPEANNNFNAQFTSDEVQPVFDLNMDDTKIIQSLHHRIEASKAFFDTRDGYNLTNAREQNMRLWLGKHLYRQPFYSYSQRFIDNRTFVAIQAIVAYLTASVASPEVWPADSSPVSKMLAKDVEDWLEADNNDIHLAEKMRSVVYHLLLKRGAYLKQRWDESAGKNGKLLTEAVDPSALVIDQYAPLGENPGFISEAQKASVEELCDKFPDKADAIRSLSGIQRGTTRQMSAVKQYREVWFSWYDSKPREAVCWYMGNLVMGKMDNPNWNNNGSNIMDAPPKPYAPFNFINDGSSWIDQTTLVEQAWFQQDMLNKRGRQLMELADRANGQKVISKDALNDEDAADLSDHPNQKLVVDAQDVTKAVMNLAPPQISPVLIQDKQDLRNEIDTILGTPSAFRGDNESSPTATQDLLQKNQSQGRQDDIVRSLETGLDRYYKIRLQMMKVYLSKEAYYAVSKDNAEFDFIGMSKSKMPQGLSVRVSAGTSLPYDKARAATVALELAKLGQIDPISLYEDLDLPDADKRAKRLMEYNADPAAYVGGIADDNASRSAYADYWSIMDGGTAEPRSDVDQKHLDTHTKQMMLPDFLNADPMKKQAFVTHVQLESQLLQQVLSVAETQLPTPQEVMQNNQQQAQQAQLMPPQPGDPNAPQGAPQASAQAPAGPDVGAPPPPTPPGLPPLA